jgi:voltage-gated potassium channel Kch
MHGTKKKRSAWRIVTRVLAPAHFSDRRRLQWLLTVFATLIMLWLGTWGYDEYDRRHGITPHFSDNLYHSFALLRFRVDERHRTPGEAHHSLPWQLEVARILVPVVIFLFGVLSLAAFLGVDLQRKVARGMKGHVVVAGQSDAVEVLVRGLLEENTRAVVVRPEREVQRGTATYLESLGATVVGGEATDPEVLDRAGIRGAQALVALDPSDLTNMEVLLAARARVDGLRRSGQGSLRAVARIGSFSLYQQLLSSDIPPFDSDDAEMTLFATNGAMARAVSLDLSWYPQTVVDGAETFHAALFGFGELGGFLVQRLAQQVWFHGMQRREFTIFAPDGERQGRGLLNSAPWLEQVCNIRFVDLDGDSGVPGHFSRFLLGLQDAPPQVAYICFEDDDLALECMMELARVMVGTPLQRTHLKVRVSGRPNLTRRWRQVLAEGRQYLNVSFFGDFDQFYQPDEVLREVADETARAVHNAYSRNFGAETSATSKAWQRLPESFRDANRQQADSLLLKLCFLGCRSVDGGKREVPVFLPEQGELEQLARCEHQRWMAERLSKGWRKGAKRDDARRIHTSLVDYEALSEREKNKDRQAVLFLFRLVQAGGMRFGREQRLGIITAAGESGGDLDAFLASQYDPQRPLVLIVSLLSEQERRAASRAVEEWGAVLWLAVPLVGGQQVQTPTGAGLWAMEEPALMERVEITLYLPMEANRSPDLDPGAGLQQDRVNQMRQVLERRMNCRCWVPT